MQEDGFSARTPGWCRLFGIAAAALVLSACSKKEADKVVNSSCASGMADGLTSSSGSARVFDPDPISETGDTSISPSSVELNKYANNVDLTDLGGRGVLEGKFVDVRNGLD